MSSKLYCVVSKESIDRMKGIRGKMTAQAGHAYLHAFWDAENRFPEAANFYKNSQEAIKITVCVEKDEELLALYEKYKNICGATKVIDAGKTLFKGIPTLTCVGLGPLKKEEISDDLSHLPLFK